MSDNKSNNVDNQFNKMKQKLTNNGPKKPFNFYWIYAVVFFLLISSYLFSWNTAMVPSNEQEFNTFVEAGDVKEVVIYNKEVAEVFLTKEALNQEPHKSRVRKPMFAEDNTQGPHYVFNIGSPDEFYKDLTTLKDKGYDFKYAYRTRQNFMDSFGWLLPIVLMIVVWVIIMRRMGAGAPGAGGGQIFSIGKSKAQLFDKDTSVRVTFNDVAGLEGSKEEIQEIVDFLKNPKRYTALGAKIPKGALLIGPPGTGKTLLAKAVAGEAQVPFFSLSGSDFVEMFVGVGASRVRDLFRQAKEKAPCIIFIDEIDAIGRARGKSPAAGANDERENTLNQLLTEMDGFGTNTGVIILAATNRADILDRALLRPGRFDRQIHVDMPDLNERQEIFKVHLRPLKLDQSVDVAFLARQTPGFSGADIANICNEAALIAARKNKPNVGRQDFLDAVDRIIGGLEKKSKIITPDEKKRIAYHEAGHATVSWLLQYASPLVKVTIVPRGNSLGAAWYLPEERSLTTKAQILDEMCAALGGRAAEQIVFGEVSTGALSDLEKVTKQAQAMVSVYGLNEKIGNISYYDSSGQSDYSFQKPYSEQTAQVIDQEISAIIESMYQKTVQLLTESREKLDALANKLLEKEVIFKEDMVEIFGERPFDTDRKIEGSENDSIKPIEEPKALETAAPEALAESTTNNAAEENGSTTDSNSEEPKAE